MSIWAIADIHASRLDRTTGRAIKPMDLFGAQWDSHMERLEQAWETSVLGSDTVIVAGDIDWALHLEDARETLCRIDSWKGNKILLRGNHDYWWSSKATSRVRKALPPTLALLHNNAFQVEGFNVCGAKGSPVPGGIDWTADDEKLYRREEHRLSLSLEARDINLPTIVALHYPPFYPPHTGTAYQELLTRDHVSACVYGHLHGQASSSGPTGRHDGLEYFLVAGDFVEFRPVPIATDGGVVPQRETPHALTNPPVERV